MPVAAERTGDLLILRIRGESDSSDAEQLPSLLSQAEPVIIDLSSAAFIDSTIVGALLGAFRRANAREQPFVVYLPDGAGAYVQRIFDITGIRSRLPIARDWDDALSRVRQDPEDGGLRQPDLESAENRWAGRRNSR